MILVPLSEGYMQLLTLTEHGMESQLLKLGKGKLLYAKI